MPMPMPHNDEDHDTFMGRCHREMKEEFPKQDQRNAVCQRQWDDKDKDKALAFGGGGLRYEHILAYVRDTPWAILPGTLVVILDLLAFRAGGGRLTAEEIQQRIGAATRPIAQNAGAGAVAVLPLFGVIGHRMGTISDMSGGTSVERFSQQFRQLANDPSIGAIILDVDSPGGTVSGVDELSTEIYQARGRKPIAAVANSLAASAAYWIATAAGEVSVIPSGEVGSIGVLAVHEDISGETGQRGRKVTLISAGKYKAQGNPFEPLTDEARATIQERVDDYYGMFVRSIARNRGVSVEAVRSGFGEGRTVGAKRALEMGMVDHVETLDAAIARLGKQTRQNRPTAAEAPDSPVQAGELDLRRRRLRAAGQ